MRANSIGISIVAALCCFVGLCLTSASLRAADVNGVIDEFDVARDGAPLVVPVTLKGLDRTARMLVDTGCTAMLIDIRHRRLLGEPVGKITGATPNGSLTVEQFAPVDGAVGSIRLSRDEPFACMDLTKISEELGVELDGILGMDFLRRQIVHIDFDRGKLRFLSEIPAGVGESIEMKYDEQKKPTIQVVWGGLLTRPVGIDTGWFGSNSVSPETFDELANRGDISHLRATRSRTLTGDLAVPAGVLDRLTVARYEHSLLRVHLATTDFIGINYLSRYQVVFDFPQQHLYLKEGDRFAVPEQRDRSGLKLVKRNGRYLVAGVLRRSPAKRAGLERDDVLLTIDGADVEKYTLFQLRGLLNAFATTRSIRLQRGPVEIDVAIELSD